MDPDKNLQRQLIIAGRIMELEDAAHSPDETNDKYVAECKREIARLGGELASLVTDLNIWLCGGGFYPTRWQRGR